MLPEDSKARRDAAAEKLKQSQVDDHFTVVPEGEKPMPYSDEVFKEAAIQWLIETDQVSFCSLFENHSYFFSSLPAYSSVRAPNIQTYDISSFTRNEGG